MNLKPMNFLRIAVALSALSWPGGVLLAQASPEAEAELAILFAELQEEKADWERIETRIQDIWAKSGSDSIDLLLERGREAMDAGDFIKATEHFSALIDHAPEFAEAWNARATAYFLMGNYGLSIADVQQTLALNPRHFGALSGLGIMLEELGDPVNALKALKASQALHPHHAEINDAIERLEKQTGGMAL